MNGERIELVNLKVFNDTKNASLLKLLGLIKIHKVLNDDICKQINLEN